MSAYYVETGALLKRYKSEPGSEVVRELFDRRRPDDELVTSHFTVLEFTAVAARLRRAREIRARQHERLLASFLADLRDYRVRVLPVDDTLIDDALSLLPSHALRAPDAIHVASALSYRASVRPAMLYLVSGDKDITTACRDYPLPYFDPEDPGALAQLRRMH